VNNDILLNRKIVNWGWYTNSNTFRVFIHLLLLANWKDGDFQGYPLKRGECLFGLISLSKTLQLSIRSIRTSLEHLKSTNEITIKTTNKFSIATIVKYNDYQMFESQSDKLSDKLSDKQTTNKRQTNDKQTTTSKEVKEVKEIKNDKNNIYSDLISEFSIEFQNAFLAFSEMRAKIKKPLTFHAAELNLKKLDELSKSEDEKIDVLNQSVMSCWQGLFPLKDKKEIRDAGHIGDNSKYEIKPDGTKTDQYGNPVI
jgi:hypothetical protein